MSEQTIRVRTEVTSGVTSIKMLIQHPMITGLQKNKNTGKRIPPYFIREVHCEIEGKRVFTAIWGIGISTNPFLSFRLAGAHSQEELKISWIDNLGKSDTLRWRL